MVYPARRLVSLSTRLLEALEEVIGGELLSLGCHHHRLLHRLLLVEVLDLVQCDALHAASRGTCRTSKYKSVILGVSAGLWR